MAPLSLRIMPLAVCKFMKLLMWSSRRHRWPAWDNLYGSVDTLPTPELCLLYYWGLFLLSIRYELLCNTLIGNHILPRVPSVAKSRHILHCLMPPNVPWRFHSSPTETARAANIWTRPINCSHFINVLSVHHCSSGFVMASYGWRSSVSGLPGIRSILIDVLSKRNVKWMVQLPPSITPPSFLRLAWTNWENISCRRCRETRSDQRQLQWRDIS